MIVLSPFRRLFLTLAMFAAFCAAGAIGYLISLTFGLSGDGAMWAMSLSYFLPLIALTLWLGLKNSN